MWESRWITVGIGLLFKIVGCGGIMGLPEKKTFTYYAFISYSRKDEDWAKWLQKKLETYRIPSVIRKQNLNIPQKLYPVFRDKTDLTGGRLLESLQEELESSQYLIVLCSPNSAGSEWVDKETGHFIRQGREEYIIPFIVDGEPGAADAGRECYPKSLREETESEILGINVGELGKEKAFLRVVAALLNLKFDQVVMRDRRRRRKQRIFAALACLALVIGALAGIWHYMPHSAYYRDFVCRYEIPQGLYPLSREERRGRAEYYRIVTRQGKVVRLERLNSLGKLVQSNGVAMEDAYASIDYFYEENKLSRQELRDASNSLLLVRDYSSNLKAVDFQRSDDSSQAYALSAVQGGYGLGMDNSRGMMKSEITRCINTYDEDGFLMEERFMRDNRNTPVADNNGNYGLRYEREATGQTKRTIGLDENGNPHNCKYGYAIMEYSYDEEGYCTALEYLDADGKAVRNENGYSRADRSFDSLGNMISVEYLDERGRLCNMKDGYARVECLYTGQGLMEQASLWGMDGEPVCSKESGIHAYCNAFGEQGDIKSVEYYGEGMQPVCNYDGYARIDYTYDTEGRVREELYFGTEGEPACDKKSGCFGILYQWDGDGRNIRDTYLDARCSPTISRYGYASIEWQYDPYGNIWKESYYDAEGKPICIRENNASVECEYNETGNWIKIDYKDERGRPCMITDGYAGVTCTYDDHGNQDSVKYYDEKGEPAIISEGYHEYRGEYDEHGNCIREEYRGVDGELLTCAGAGYAFAEYGYDEYGNMLECAYYGEEGVPKQVKGCSRICWEYNEKGNLVRETKYPWGGKTEAGNYFTVIAAYEYDEKDNLIEASYWDGEGQPYSDEKGAHAYLCTYDNRNRVICMDTLFLDGRLSNVVKYEYDERNQKIREFYYVRKEVEEEEQFIVQIWYFYDDSGNIIREESRDQEGNMAVSATGFAYLENSYTMAGDVCETAYYDEKGNPYMNQDGYARKKTEYGSMGNVMKETYYGEKGNVLRIITFEYSSQGWALSRTCTDEEGNWLSEDGYSSRIEIQYDKSGRETGRIYYDEDGNRLTQSVDSREQ